MNHKIQHRKSTLATPCPTWRVVDEPSYPIQHRPQSQSEVIRIIQQQKGTTSTMKLFILIILAGAILGFAMFSTANHMIDATPHVQQTAQVQAEWAGRAAIAAIEASVAKETNMTYNAFRMFEGAATFGVVLLVVVAAVGGLLWLGNNENHPY